ncbi:MAG TPA: flagellar motor switch protein FliG [Verrucomicrobiae bacterium]|jgi:flagellar motor switch protein FliG|nr:flagellar motor switch protein FliG [Verrucomicrobiae bacterium]
METEIPILDFAKMTKMQKLAALLIILGPESAAQMLKNFDEHELETISLEMSKLTVISQDLQREILREFTEVAVQASTAILGGVTYTKTALEKSVGMFRASDIIGRVAPAPVPVVHMQQIIDMDCRQLFNLLKHEQPQTIALIVSYLSAEKSSQLLLLLRPDLRDLVVERLATLGPTPVEVVERIVEVLNTRAGAKSTRALNQTGGLKLAAEVLNSIDKNISQSMLLELEKRNPELGQAIRQKMFTFDDLSLLDGASLQKVMREVDMRDLAVALKTANPKLRAALLASISKRAAETVNEEISFLGPLKKKDIEAAQMRIIESVRQLETEGEIDLSNATSSSRDEVMV